MTRVCFVCLGNICRSPTAEGVFRRLLAEEGRTDVEVDSAGTSAWHVGDPPDPRSTAEARRRGIDLTDQRSRRFSAHDFDRFDLVVAMERSNAAALEALAPTEEDRAKVRLLREFDPDADGVDVPDPYAGGPTGFVRVFDMVERACRGLLASLPPR